uniref:Ig-like domain-containing protein n=3 Tax=Gasterosteus aculeatus aculeatus TaxID=481459 RepID=A0AAQ4PJG4_GASAC
MEIAAIHFIILMAMSGLTKGAGVLSDGPLNAAVGETVVFNPTLTSSETLIHVLWIFGDNIIIEYNTYGPNNTNPEYEGRIFISNGSLELRNVTSNDSGQYSVIITLIVRDGGKIAVGVTELDVNERISGASVTSETNLSIEGNSFNLSCDADGSMISREWKKDGVKLTPDDHLSLQENNRVLTFNSLSRKDTGVYLCNVTNPVSQEGAEYKMVVYYGPENVQIKGPSDIDLKTTLTLTCSAESVPASYTWMLNSTKIHNSAVYTKDNTEPSDSGIYICEVMNNVTGRTSSALHGLSVTGAPGLSGTEMLLILLMHLIIEVTHRVSRLIILSAVGAISGIVILCLVASSAGAGGGYYIYKKKINKNATPRP